MKKLIRYTLLSLWIILSRSYDAWCTYQYTPDLSLEANPLVSIGGMDWTALLLTIGILTLLILYAYYRSVFHPINMYPEDKDYTFQEFSTYFYLGRKEKWTAFLYQIPNSWSRFTHYMGRVMPPALAWAGIVSTVMWILIRNTETYMTHYHSVKLIYGIILLGMVILAYQQLRNNYRLYRQDLSQII